MTQQQTRVALITTQDPESMSSWSGTQYRVYQQLQKRFDVVEPLGPVRLNALERFLVKVAHRLCERFLKKYNKIHSLLLGYLRARRFNRKIRRGRYNLVFASACCPVAAFLDARAPIVYLSDATFDLLIDYYDQFTDLSRLSLWEGRYAEQKAIEKAAAVILSSDWARESAVEDYGAAPDKVSVCLFGANVDDAAVAQPQVAPEKMARVGREVNLLFLARDWRRKGGTVALEAFRELQRRGYRATLTVCGCEPESAETGEGLTVIPYLDKSLEKDRHRYYELMRNSHFLVLPTVADCTPMVFAEANAYGMPVVTSNTGGVPSLVRDRDNGFLLSPEAAGADYADVIEREFFANPEAYQGLVARARLRYEQALNWDSWGRCTQEFVNRRLANQQPGLSPAAQRFSRN